MKEVVSRPVNCGIKIANILCLPGLAYARQARQKPFENSNTFGIGELDWFIRNCYNAGIRGIVEWGPSICLRIFQACTEFTMLYPENVDSAYRRLLCFHASALLRIEMARLADTLECKLRHYVLARKHVEDFRALYGKWNGTSESEVLEIKEKFISLLPFDFEGAVKLRDWKVLDKLVDEAISFGTLTGLEGIEDLMVFSTAPMGCVQRILKKVVDHLVSTPNTDFPILARWIRLSVRDYLPLALAGPSMLTFPPRCSLHWIGTSGRRGPCFSKQSGPLQVQGRIMSTRK